MTALWRFSQCFVSEFFVVGQPRWSTYIIVKLSLHHKKASYGPDIIAKSATIGTAQNMKFAIKDFFSSYDQICCFLRIWSHLLKKSLMKNFIFCAVRCLSGFQRKYNSDLSVIFLFRFFCLSCFEKSSQRFELLWHL